MKVNARGTLAITANGTSLTTALPVVAGGLARLVNVGPQNCFFEFVNDANKPTVIPASTVGGAPLVANAPAEVFRMPTDATHLALISGGNSTVYVTRGDVV